MHRQCQQNRYVDADAARKERDERADHGEGDQRNRRQHALHALAPRKVGSHLGEDRPDGGDGGPQIQRYEEDQATHNPVEDRSYASMFRFEFIPFPFPLPLPFTAVPTGRAAPRFSLSIFKLIERIEAIVDAFDTRVHLVFGIDEAFSDFVHHQAIRRTPR